MKWLSAFLCRKKHSALFAIGDDAPSVFFEIWYTSANSRVRGEAKGIAIKLIEVYERSLLKGKQGELRLERVLERSDSKSTIPDSCMSNNHLLFPSLLAATKPINVFFECMFVLRCKNEMNLDTGPLLALADKIFKEQDFQDTNKLFGVQGTIESLRAVSVEDWLMLLMKIMVMDFNNLLFPRRFPVTWGMKLALSALKGVPLYPPPKDLNDEEGKSKFHHSFYLATHIIYAIGAYSSVKTEAKAIPWLYGYCRKSLKFWMKRAHLKDKLMKNGDSGDSIYVDVDGIAECADVLRGQGLTEATDRLLCEASVWMLGKQKKEGSWPIWTTAPKEDWEPYDYLHPSWVCTQALRDRDFDVGFTRPGNVLWKKFIAKVLAEAKLDERVGWRIDWKRGEVVMEDNDV